MLSKGDLLKLVRTSTGLTQKQFGKKMRTNRLETISSWELGKKDISYQRLCQIYVIYIKLCVRDEQLDNIFNNYIEKMFRED